MNRIENSFKTPGKKAFVPYIMAGDGGLDALKERILFLERNGATAVEIGIPFSDPVADGPTIQRAGIRALQEGTTLTGVLDAIRASRKEISIPLIVMTYLNPVLAYGVDRFVADSTSAGVDGCIIPDLPMEEEDIIAAKLEQDSIPLIRLVTPTSPQSRLDQIAANGKGYLYAVTVTGITGARTQFDGGLGEFLGKVKKASSIPVLAGFGISTSEQVKEVNQLCDGVIVGSKIVDLFENNDLEGIAALMQAAVSVEA
ncbi:tryptophan synthase subunit alpha [Bacillus sp. T33-2]|nr:tryptophan synthase subunit alpha [Bacillus sp. T33-2]